MTKTKGIEILGKCAEYDCEEPPTIIVFWPGKIPPPVYCEGHAEKAVSILNYMGTPVHWERIG